MTKITHYACLGILAFSLAACGANGVNNLPTLDSVSTIKNIKTLKDMKEIAFEWDPLYDENIKGFLIYASKNDESNKTLIANIKDKYKTHYVHTNLEPNTIYNYSFIAYTKDALSKESAISVKTSTKIEPVPFVQAISGLPNKIKIIWRPHPDTRVNSYIIVKQSANSDTFKEIANVDNRLSAEYIDNTKANEYAKYAVIAKTYNAIKSDLSEFKEATSKVLPPMVTNLSATTNVAKKIILTWDAASYKDFSHYKIYSSSSKFLPFSLLATTKNTNYTDEVQKDGYNKTYYVTMVDVDGLESKSDGIYVTGMSLNKPKTPIFTGYNILNDNSIYISFKASDNRVKKFNILKNSQEFLNNVSVNNFTDSAYEKGDTYQIIGIDEYGISSDTSDKLKIK